MTQDQLVAVLRQLLSFAGGIFVAKGYLTGDQLIALGALAAPLVAIYFSFRKSSPGAQVKTAEALPGVNHIEVNDPELKKAAPNVTLRSSGMVMILAIALAFGLGGCAQVPSATMDPAVTAGVQKTLTKAEQTAQAGLTAVCANYQFVDAAFQVYVTFSNKVPKKYVDAEAGAIALITDICSQPITNVQTAYAAAIKAYTTALNIRNQFRNA